MVNALLLVKTCLPDRQAPTAAKLVSHLAVSAVAGVFTGNFSYYAKSNKLC